MNALVLEDVEELEVFVVQTDKLQSFVGKKTNDQWLWLVIHKKSRQILAFHIGKRAKQAAEPLLAKLPLDVRERGEQFVERILSVVETIQIQGRNILDYLVACFTA